MFHDLRFTNVATEFYPIPPELALHWYPTILTAAESSTRKAMNKNGPSLLAAARYHQQVQNVLSEVKAGVMTQWQSKVIIGIKWRHLAAELIFPTHKIKATFTVRVVENTG